MNRLSARGISVTPPAARAPVVESFDIDVAPGEWVALTGPNGSGKTSLLMALSGLWPCTGEVLLDGQSFTVRSPPEARRSVAVILQSPADQLLQPTVGEEIRMTGLYLGMPPSEVDARADQWTEAFGLGHLLHHPPQELSAGEQQLVLLAAALVPAPTLLLADEPAAHLSPGSRSAVHRAIDVELRRGMSVVWVTQDPEDLAAAGRVLLLGMEASTYDRDQPGGFPHRGDPPGGMAGALLGTVRIDDGWSEGEGTTIAIPRHGVVGLTGPNGTGKSRLIRALSRLEASDVIRVEWAMNGYPQVSVSLEYPEMQISEERVKDELMHAATMRGMTADEALKSAAKLLEIFELNRSILGARTWDLSSGEKRLVELVAAFVAPAHLYLLDEPTAGLDRRRRGLVAGVIEDISHDRSVLIASQDADWLAGLGCPVTRLDRPQVPET